MPRPFSSGSSSGGRGRPTNNKRRQPRERFMRNRTCRFCEDKKMKVDYKDARALSPYVTERGKIVPRRITANCAYHQREVTLAIKRARILALLPFTATQDKW